jgi:hypothetical protein
VSLLQVFMVRHCCCTGSCIVAAAWVSATIVVILVDACAVLVGCHKHNAYWSCVGYIIRQRSCLPVHSMKWGVVSCACNVCHMCASSSHWHVLWHSHVCMWHMHASNKPMLMLQNVWVQPRVCEGIYTVCMAQWCDMGFCFCFFGGGLCVI